MKCTFFIFVAIILSGCKSEIDRFYEAEQGYTKYLKGLVQSQYNPEPELVVVEYALKRSPDGIESELEKYVYIAALDKNDITDISNPEIRSMAEKEDINIQEVAIYYGVFQVPSGDFSPKLFSFGVRRSILNNKWADLVKP